jgi:hypothetical protein
VTVGIADVVNWADIRDTVVVSLFAGVGLCAAYSLVLLGSVRPASTMSTATGRKLLSTGSLRWPAWQSPSAASRSV